MRIFFTCAILLSFCTTFSQNISGVVNIYRKVLWVDSSKGAVKLTDVSGFTSFNGRKAMIIQMKGATIDETQTAAFGNINSINNAGNYEIGTICGFLSDTMIFERKFNNFYNVGSHVQCVIFPDFTGDVTVVDTLKAAPWDPVADTGGVLAIDVPGNLILNRPISVDDMGFRGAAVHINSGNCSDFTFGPPFNTATCPEYHLSDPPVHPYKHGGKKGEGIADYITSKSYAKGKQANGGGGGNNSNNGGGGGSNYGTGGSGGNKTSGSCTLSNSGIGGVALSSVGYSSVNNRIFLGGGGGAGHQDNDVGTPGGNGGGIVYIACNSLQSNNEKITANGGRPYRAALTDPYASYSDGAGGGGGAGVIIINSPTIMGSLLLEASGAKGSNSESNGGNQCTGPGGGGAGGVIWLSLPVLPLNITAIAIGGAAGFIQNSIHVSACTGNSNGATAGGAGAVLFNYAPAPLNDSSLVCKAILPIHLLVALNGQVQNNIRELTARVSDKENVHHCILQKSTAGSFADIASQINNHSTEYIFTDAAGDDALYRVKIITKTGSIVYSGILNFKKKQNNSGLSIEIFPNPAKEKINLQVHASSTGAGTIIITDAVGKILFQQKQLFRKGLNSFPVMLNEFHAGVLFIKVSTNDHAVVKSLVNLPH